MTTTDRKAKIKEITARLEKARWDLSTLTADDRATLAGEDCPE